MMQHIFNVLLRALLGFIVGALLWIILTLIYWTGYPYETADVFIPIEVLNTNNEVLISSELELLVLFDKKTDVAPDISRNVICEDGNVYAVETPNASASRPRGDGQVAISYYNILRPQEEQNCVFRFIAQYQVNPIRVVTKVWDSEPFDITIGE